MAEAVGSLIGGNQVDDRLHTALLRQVGPLVRSSRAPEAERVVPGSWSLSSVEEEIDP